MNLKMLESLKTTFEIKTDPQLNGLKHALSETQAAQDAFLAVDNEIKQERKDLHKLYKKTVKEMQI